MAVKFCAWISVSRGGKSTALCLATLLTPKLHLFYDHWPLYMAFYVHKCAFLKHDLSIPRVLTRPRASHPNTKAAGCGSSVSSTNPTMSCKLRNIPPSFQIKGGSCLSVSILVTKLWPQAVIFDSNQFYFEFKYMFVPSLISLPRGLSSQRPL